MNHRTYEIQILGRILEHLGVQMYKQRDAAIAELVANAWDAGATEVKIFIPTDNYNPEDSSIIVLDNGVGMSPDEVQSDYLVVGRNTRRAGKTQNPRGFPIMGRKGIGKLAGFGIASRMTLETWRDESKVVFSLDIDNLKADDGKVESKQIEANIFKAEEEYNTGTRVTLEGLKHSTPIDIESLHRSLARRFERLVKGEMQIFINNEILQEYEIEGVIKSVPETNDEGGYLTHKLDDGNEVKFRYIITEKVIPHTFLQGFSILANGKVAQSPPFYFGVESTASHQHGAKYFSGEIIADFLDQGSDDDSDVISTDRQEISWDDPTTQSLKLWGQELSRKVLYEWYDLRKDAAQKWVLDDQELLGRIQGLTQSSQRSVNSMIGVIGGSGVDKEVALDLSGQIVRAYEFQQFHDVVEEIEAAAEEDPAKLVELLEKLKEWKVLESRALLELITGRLGIADKLHTFVVNNVPETASSLSSDNMHDLLARMPWLINPDWEMLDEEKSISKQLQEWNAADLNISEEDSRKRYDFLALRGESELVIVEIKRSGHAVELEELQRAETYKERLSRANQNVGAVCFISSGNFNISESGLRVYRDREDFMLTEWRDLYERTRKHYEHYRGVLEGNSQHSAFSKKVREAQHYKTIGETGTVKRSKEERAQGVG